MVTEAKSIQPEMDTGDPLTGAVIHEDRSSTWTVGEDGAPEMESPEETTLTGGQVPGAPVSSTAQATGTPVQAPTRNEPSLPSQFADDDYDEPTSKGGLGKVIAGLAALIVVGGLAIIGIVVAVVVSQMPADESSTSVASNREAVEEQVVEAPQAALPDGGTIVNAGTSKKTKSKSTTLTTNAKDGANIKIKDIFGLRLLGW